jgi:hypothetical protein
MIPGIVASIRIVIGGGGPGPDPGDLWTPADITTQLWFDAADTDTVTISSGVSQLEDKSGNNRDVAQATAANRPTHGVVTLNSLPVLHYDGSNDSLVGAANLAGLGQNVPRIAYYVVRRFGALAGSAFPVVFTIGDGDAANNTNARFGHYASEVDNIERPTGQRTDAQGLDSEDAGAIAGNTWQLFAIHSEYLSALCRAWRDGTSVLNTTHQDAGNTSNTAPSSIGVGSWVEGSFSLDGDIAEIIVTHAIDDRLKIEGYLAWKWGLQANLPAAHPYKAAAPLTSDGGDPFYDDVVSLLKFNASGTTFTDEKGVAWTPAGNATCGAVAPQYGSGALELDGTGDWLNATDAVFVHNTRDFTMEAWHRIGATLTGNHFIFSYAGGWGVYALTFNFGWALFDGAASNVIVGGGGEAVPLIYKHIALCRAAGIYRLFVDGLLVGSPTSDATNITSNAVRIGAQPGGTGGFNGQIDEFRITRRARYTEAFTPPAAPFGSFRTDLIDPHFASVVALLNFEGANAQTWFLDERGNLWTRSGTPTISTAQTPGFGTSCLDDPSAQNYIVTESHANFGYGTGDFTIEFYARPTTLAGGPQIWYDQRTALNQLRPALYHAGSGDLRLYVGGSDRIAAPTGTIVVDTWHHIALCRASGSTRLFVNGVQVGSTFADATDYEASRVLLGNAGDQDANVFGFTGQFKCLRITKGVARYPTNFTPPSALFPVS